MSLNTKLFLGFLAALVIGNLVILDVVILAKPQLKTQVSSVNGRPSEPFTVSSTASSSQDCSGTCEEKINNLIASLSVTPVSKTTTPTPTQKVSKATTTTVTSSVKEYFVPLGAGSSSAADWSDVTGVQASVDSNQYGSIRSVVFEASLNTPTGNQLAYARLYNLTDNHPVWNSEVMIEGGDSKLLISAPITLDSGNKLYQVQMKTQLKFQTNLSQSRIHITTN